MRIDGALRVAGLLEALARLEEVSGDVRPPDVEREPVDHAARVFAFVLGFAFILLLLTFRSIVIPLKTIVLNLLSVGAAYGVVTLIFQNGHLRSLLGAENVDGVINWLPLFLFVVLFGLSMDYHVLILSRVREEHERGMTTAHAVAEGVKSTAGVVTSAAVVMVGVFSIFAILPEIAFSTADPTLVWKRYGHLYPGSTREAAAALDRHLKATAS